MTDEPKLLRAELIELKPDFKDKKPNGRQVTVQFNPESLKVAFANQIVTPENAGSQRGTAGQLHVGAGTTKLTLQLWFDVSRLGPNDPPADDVRDLTKQVAFFITPQPVTENGEEKFIPPAVRFLWGTFHFDGVMESVEETLDYWSHDGKPIRANMSLSLTQQKIEALKLENRKKGKEEEIARLIGGGSRATAGRRAGTTPMAAAPSGSSVQSLTGGAGIGLDWQTVAAANGIENPRLLQPGQLLNLNPVNVRAGLF